jgi:phosphonate transport system substrate-binding protein
MRASIKFFFIFAFAAIFVLPAYGGERPLRLGLISDNPEARIKEYMPLMNNAAARLKEFGIKEARILVAKDIDEMLKKIERNEVDIVFESAFSTVEMQDKAAMTPAMLVWRKGVREYKTLFFVRKESPAKSLSDLKGRTIVFEDPKSTSAYAIPKAALKRRGLTVLPLSEKKELKDAVRYLFAGEELNQAFFVIQKRADAGAFNTNDWNELSEKVRAELRIIHETEPMPRYIASFHPRLPERLRKAIEAVFEGMDKNPEGKDLLKRASRITKIERLTDADLNALKDIKELRAFIE